MPIIDPNTRERMNLVAQRAGLVPFRSSSLLGDLAEGLLGQFPELRSERARSLREAIDIVIPWIKGAAIAAVTACAIRVIGAAAMALSVKVVLCLCVIALAIYLLAKVFPGVRYKLDEIFAPINRAFAFGAPIGPLEFRRSYELASSSAAIATRLA